MELAASDAGVNGKYLPHQRPQSHANGNLLTRTEGGNTTTYTWDARNRLTAITGPGLSATFSYDGLGRRAAKTLNGQDTSFQYVGVDVVQESGGTGAVSYLRALGIDEVLARSDTVSTLFSLAEALGSTVALSDATGATPTTYTYAPFGATAVTGTPSASPFQFTGRENDGTGLYYYRARYYDPVRSRFVSEDPLGFATGQTNLHTYVLANPLRFTDPHGLWTVSVGARIGATGFGYGVGGGMSINIGYSGGEGLSASLTGTFAGGASSASLLGGSSAGVQVDVSNASSVEGLTGAVVEGGRGLGRSGLGGFVSPGGNVKGGSLTIGIASRPSTLDIPGVSAGGSDTSSIIQIDRNGLHIGRRNGQSLLDLPVGCWLAGRCGVGGGGMLGPRKDRPPGSGND